MSEEKYSVCVTNQDELEDVLWYEDMYHLHPHLHDVYFFPARLLISTSSYRFGEANIHYDNIQAWREAVAV